MSANIIDGKLVANTVIDSIITKNNIRLKKNLRPPGLAVILVGDSPASQIYVKNKARACINAGFKSFKFELEDNTSQAELLKLIDELNNNPEVDGILVQLPLPQQIDPRAIIEAISPHKDVDGFHPYNLGRLAQKEPTLRSCTPYGIMQLLEYYNLDPSGKTATVVGASNIVGRPMALELMLARATVTICHSKTINLQQHIENADIVVVAVGKMDMISPNWFKPNAIVIDVGIHRLKDGKLRGDLDFNACKDKVAWLTPVPGGVGPMTIATLLKNTLIAAENNDK